MGQVWNVALAARVVKKIRNLVESRSGSSGTTNFVARYN